jgi:hypothetical protein
LTSLLIILAKHVRTNILEPDSMFATALYPIGGFGLIGYCSKKVSQALGVETRCPGDERKSDSTNTGLTSRREAVERLVDSWFS